MFYILTCKTLNDTFAFVYLTAFEYRDLRHNGRSSLLEVVNIVDQVHHHRSKRDLALTNQTDCQNASLSCKDTTKKVGASYFAIKLSFEFNYLLTNLNYQCQKNTGRILFLISFT